MSFFFDDFVPVGFFLKKEKKVLDNQVETSSSPTQSCSPISFRGLKKEKKEKRLQSPGCEL